MPPSSARQPRAARRRASRGPRVRPALDALVNADLLLPMYPRAQEYIFQHTLIQDTAHESLLKNDRKRLNLLVAETLERLYPNRLNEHAAALTLHYAEAGDDARTLHYARIAGAAAARLYAHAEAITYFTLALDAARRTGSETPFLSELYLQRGRALELSGDYPRALQNYEDMLAAARARADRPLELDALIALAIAYAIGGPVINRARADELAHRALALARELDRPADLARVYWILVLTNRFVMAGGDPHRAVAYGDQALALARTHRLRELEALVLKDLNAALLAIGQLPRVRRNADLGLALWRDLNNLPMLAEMLTIAALAHLQGGELDTAIRYGDEALEINTTLENPFGLTVTAAFISQAHRECGDLNRFFELARTAISAGMVAGLPLSFMPRLETALVTARLGDVPRGIELARRTAEWAAGHEGPDSMHLVSAVLAWMYWRNGDVAASRAALRDVPTRSFAENLARYSAGTSVPLLAGIYAQAELWNDRPDAGRAILEDMVQTIRQYELPLMLPHALVERAAWFRATGQLDAARADLHEARALATRMGTRYSLLFVLLALFSLESALGDATAASAVAAEARPVITFLSDHMPADLHPAFASQPEVLAVRRGGALP